MRQRRARRYASGGGGGTGGGGSSSSGGGAGGGGRVRPRLSEAERSRLGERRGAGVAQAGRRAEARRPLPPFVWPPRGGSAARPRSSSATAGPAPGPGALSPSASSCHFPRPRLPRRPWPWARAALPRTPAPLSLTDVPPPLAPLAPSARPAASPSLCRPLRPVPSPGRARSADGGGRLAEGRRRRGRPRGLRSEARGGRERVPPGAGGSAGRRRHIVLSGRQGPGWSGARKGVFLCPLLLRPTPPPQKPGRVRAGARRRDGWGKLRGLPLCFLSQC